MSPVTRPIGRRESLAAWLVVSLLVVVAGGVAVRQAFFSPAVAEALKAATGAAATAGSRGGADLIPRLPAALEPMSAPESFDRATLSDKINGRAELYLPAGFVGLRAQRLRMRDDRETWLEVFIYDMGGARNAFSVFSTQRREGAPALGFVEHGYRTGNAVCFVSGRYYVEVVASGTGERVTEIMEALGRALVPAGKREGEGDLGESALFPKEGQVAGSVQLIAKNAFSFGRFDDVFAAKYRDAGVTVTLFLSRRASAGEAADLAEAYRKFLLELDGKEAPAPDGTWLVDMGGSFEGAFSSDRMLAGIHQVEDPAAARKWLEKLRAAVAGGRK